MKLEDILSDENHGSRFLAQKYLSRLMSEEPSGEEIQLHKEQLLDQFGDMQVFHSILDHIQGQNPISIARKLLDFMENVPQDLVSRLEPHLMENPRVLTLSHSQTVADVIKKLDDPRVTCMRSLPGGEGGAMAEATGGTLIEDQEALDNLQRYDVVLLGCDRYSDTDFVNKVGTKALVTRAISSEIDCYLLTSELKYTSALGEIENSMFEIVSRDHIKLISAELKI